MQVACLESEKRAAYSMLREGQEVILHPSTSLGHRPEWLVFHELSLSSKLFVKTGRVDLSIEVGVLFSNLGM